MRRHLLRCAARGAIAAAAALVLVACATTRGVDAQWAAPQLAGNPLRGARVLVACEAAEEVLARICLDRLAAELQARGMTAVTAPDVAPPGPGQPRDDTRYLAAARSANARAVWVASVGPEAYGAERSGGGLSIGIGGFSFGRSSSVGLGVSMPIATIPAAPPFAADARVTDASNGLLWWTARAGAAAGDARQQIDSLLQRLLDAADKSPLY